MAKESVLFSKDSLNFADKREGHPKQVPFHVFHTNRHHMVIIYLRLTVAGNHWLLSLPAVGQQAVNMTGSGCIEFNIIR